MPSRPEAPSSLGMALIVSSSTPLLLLDEHFVIQAASGSFCRCFGIDPAGVVGSELFALGRGEWNVPQLRSLLTATVSGSAAVDAYEMDMRGGDGSRRCVIVNAHVLKVVPSGAVCLVVATSDVTEARKAARDMDALLREKSVLLQELNHRVANSLQIIASVLMHSVRKVQSEETRSHLRDAHHRVMSIAKLQRQLASTAIDEVALGPYLTDLCASISASMVGDPKSLKIVVDADASVTSPDESVSMGLIVTELVINALRHAFPDPNASGTVTITFRATHDGWSLIVGDDGVGFPGEHDETTAGLGTGIVAALAKHLEATVHVASASPGTFVSVVHSNGTIASEAGVETAV